MRQAFHLSSQLDVCFYKGLDTYAKTWIELVFPIYLIVLVVMVIVISRYSPRFANLIGKRNPVATLATLILILYTKFLSTVITILSGTTVQYPDGDRMLWKPDATIRYLEFPKHAHLFIVGFVILLLGVTYSVLLFLWQIIVRLPNWKFVGWIRNPKMSSFIETYHAPYTARYRYWTGLLLFIRVVVYLTTALNTSGDFQVPLLITAVSVGGLLLLISVNIYKKKPVSVLEMVNLSNILVFTLITWYTVSANNSIFQRAAAHISISITCIQLLIVLLYHFYTFTIISTKIRETNVYSKIKAFVLDLKERSKKDQDGTSTGVGGLEAETRDVNIFELVTQNDYSSHPEGQRVAEVDRQPQPTVSIVEITRH